MIIDAHQHFWRIGANDCAWPTPDLAAIHRDFLPDDYGEAASGLGVEGAVLVQTQPSERDAYWLLDLAETAPLVRAVVGWVDLAAPDAPSRIAAQAQRSKLRGLRPMLQSLAQDDWIMRAELSPAIEAMIAHKLSFDALVYTRHLPHLRAFAARWPDLPIIIDHGAKPPIADEALEPWRTEISATAKLPNIVCKLSGLLAETRAGQPHEALAPFVSHLVQVFGAERLIWGSDWPVLNLSAGFADWLALAQALGGFSAAESERVFSANARQFYRL
jgi:L-fucono-1,5-lactonase